MTSVVVDVAPRVSVVIPTYNRARQLERLLHALENCCAPAGGVEVIVVDDGSTDDTETVVANTHLANVVYLRQENAGAAAARNRGWNRARGEIVAFTDDDCVPSWDWLIDLVRAFETDGFVGVGGAVVPLIPGFLAQFVQSERLVSHGGDAACVHYLVTANAAFRREVLERVGGFDERFPGAAGEDTDLTYRLQDRGLRLTLIDGGVVSHDHRTTLRALLCTYYRHGKARRLLSRAHPERGIGARSVEIVTPHYWRARYGYYRDEGVSVPAALTYCALRVSGLASYAVGLMSAIAREVRPTRRR